MLGLLVGALLVYVLSNALYNKRPVGLQLVAAPDSSGKPIAIAVWYPTDARPFPTTLLGVNLLSVAGNAPVAGNALPLVVISHGNGGGPGSHADQCAVSSARWLVERTRHVHSALDHLLGAWPSHD